MGAVASFGLSSVYCVFGGVALLASLYINAQVGQVYCVFGGVALLASLYINAQVVQVYCVFGGATLSATLYINAQVGQVFCVFGGVALLAALYTNAQFWAAGSGASALIAATIGYDCARIVRLSDAPLTDSTQHTREPVKPQTTLRPLRGLLVSELRL
eukprot:gene11128-18748_t